MNGNESKSFEEYLEILKSSVQRVQADNNSLEELVASYREGAAAAKKCFEMLNQADTEIRAITDDIDAMLKEENLNDPRISETEAKNN